MGIFYVEISVDFLFSLRGLPRVGKASEDAVNPSLAADLAHFLCLSASVLVHVRRPLATRRKLIRCPRFRSPLPFCLSGRLGIASATDADVAKAHFDE